MKCRKVADRLQARAAGELVQDSELDGHLRVCARCRDEEIAAGRLEILLADLRQVEAPDLRGPIRDRLGTPDSSPRLKEKLMKTRKLTITVGLATALCGAALVGALALVPKSAMATLRRSITAVQAVHSAKVTITWSDSKGNHLRTVWCDVDRTRDETDGAVMVYQHGKTSTDPDEGLFIGQIKPTYWTLEGTLAEWKGLVPVDMGNTSLDGRPVRLVRVERERHDGALERWDYYLDPVTDLPVRYVNYVQTGGGWTETYVTNYEFNLPLPSSLFELPAGATWHQVPPGPYGKIIE
jgi:hypothetical protein